MDVDCGSARDRLGRTLGGKYHLRSILGAGGTAVVYRATTSLDEEIPVAVKVLHEHLSQSEDVCRRFVREGQLGNVLDHPGTVRVIDHGSTEEGCPYLVLEFLEGESLEERRVRAGGRLDLTETLDFCDQLLAVLEVAHSKSIVHRDIKPSNLFVTKDGALKVLDFGIARLTDDTSATSTKTGQMVGTPAFMPPEQALSRPRDVDARTDIWSVGATLFTVLSGKHVHVAETSSEHLVKAATVRARSLARALPGVPSKVEALVARCLEFDKRDRWSSAAEMRSELALVRADPGRAIGTPSSPPPERRSGDRDVPTVLGSGRAHRAPISHDGFSSGPSQQPSRDPVSETTNMSLVSYPGGDGHPFSRRNWLVPFVVGATSLLAVAGTLALVLSIRTKNEALVAGHSPVSPVSPSNTAGLFVAADPLGDAPPPDVVAPSTTHVAATPTDAANIAAAPSTTTPRITPVAPPARSAPPLTKTHVGTAKKSASGGGSRKDVYRPF